MLSVLQDVLQAAANTTQKGGSSSGYTVNNSEQNVENMASKALETTINIPPTGHVSPGTVLTVIVARDIAHAKIRERLEPQFAFIEKTFGKEFSALIR